MIVKVENLRVGDMVDLMSCPYLNGTPSAAFEYAIVENVEKENDNCIAILYHNEGLVGYKVGTKLGILNRDHNS